MFSPEEQHVDRKYRPSGSIKSPDGLLRPGERRAGAVAVRPQLPRIPTSPENPLDIPTDPMDAHASPMEVSWPGIRLDITHACEVTGISARAAELQARGRGRWSDLSILEPASREALRRALGRPESFAMALELQGNGREHAVHLHCAGHWQAARRLHVCQMADTSDLHRTQSATDHRLSMLQEMVDGLPLLIIQLDTGPWLRCAFASGALLHLVTSQTAGAVGRDALTLFGPRIYANLQGLLPQCAQGQAVPFAWHVTDTEGKARVLEGHLRSLFDDAGNASGHLIDALETTAYHETMSELRLSETRLRRFVTASSDGIVVHEGHQVVDANPAACRLLATTADALRQRRFADLIAPESRQAYREREGRASHDAFECDLVDSAGARVAVELIGRSVQRQGRQMQMAILRDVRDRKDTQARIQKLITDLRSQMERAESADRAKSLFLSAAGHDLRQPVHVIGLFLSSMEALVQSPRLQTSTLEEVTNRMRSSLDTLSRLLNSLLDISRLDANAVAVHPSPLSLGALFGDIEADFAESAIAKGLRLDVVQTSRWVRTDAVILRRILDNLVSNAIRYTRQGRVLVGARTRGDSVEIQVWDSGIGIPSDQFDAIFNEFYQLQPAADSAGGLRGLGLGLSIVKRSARLLGAALKVRSTLGRGSMLSIRLPRCDSAQPSETTVAKTLTPGNTHAGFTRRHVLVIDDDPTVLVAMQELLQAWGHEVWCAASADEAIVLAISQSAEIDLVLSDYHLGENINATEFIDAIRACILRPVPVYIFTADTSAPVARELQERGLSVLHKPVRHDALQWVLEQGLP
jgi:two-component system, sensor histidine kinase